VFATDVQAEPYIYGVLNLELPFLQSPCLLRPVNITNNGQRKQKVSILHYVEFQDSFFLKKNAIVKVTV
jgi:hypothetical protein